MSSGDELYGTFGRSSAAGSSSSVLPTPTPSSPLRATQGMRSSFDAAERPVNGGLSATAKGKQRIMTTDADLSRRSLDRRPNTATVQSSLDEQDAAHLTALSPRIQAPSASPSAVHESASANGMGDIVADIGDPKAFRRMRGALSSQSVLLIDREAPLASESKGAYRGYEKELEWQQQQQQQNGQANVHTQTDAVAGSSSAIPRSSRQRKRVSLGQVSIGSGPGIDIASQDDFEDEHNTNHLETAEDKAKWRPSSPRRTRRNRTLTGSTHAGGANLSTVRERTVSDPLGNSSSPSSKRKSEDGKYGFWLLEGGRARRPVSMVSTEQRQRPRQMSDTAVIRTPARASAPPASVSSAHEAAVARSRPQQQRVAYASNASRPSSSIMHWDPALSTAISLRYGGGDSGLVGVPPVPAASHFPKPSMDDMFSDPRPSSASALFMHDRSVASFHLGALSLLQSRLPLRPSASLASIRFTSYFARIHHATLLFQAYMHVPLTIFLDYNALFALSQVAIHPDQGNTPAAWWIALGLYLASFFVWLFVVVVVWELVLNYRKRWVNDRPFALPIYLSSVAFTLSSIRSFSLYSLFYRARYRATKRDFAIESAWFAGQNWPTVLTLLPRGIILTILLVLYNPTSGSSRLPIAQEHRDSVYFDRNTGLLTNYTYVVLLVNVAWMAWRTLILVGAWTALAVLLGPRFAFQREREAYRYKDSELALMDVRRSISTRPLLSHQSPPRANAQSPLAPQGASAEIKRHVVRTSRSIDIPRRSHSLYRDYSRVDASEKVSAHRAAPALEYGAETQSPFRQVVSPIRLPKWAWRARAEERIKGLLLECEENAIGDETWEWLDQPTPRDLTETSRHANDGATGATMDAQLSARGSSEMYETRQRSHMYNGPSLPILTLPEESIVESVSHHTFNIDKQDDDGERKEQTNTHSQIASSSEPQAVLQSKISQASLPFPRQSNDGAPEDVNEIEEARKSINTDATASGGTASGSSNTVGEYRTPRNSFGIPVAAQDPVSSSMKRTTTNSSASTTRLESMQTQMAPARPSSDSSVRSEDTARERVADSEITGNDAWWTGSSPSRRRPDSLTNARGSRKSLDGVHQAQNDAPPPASPRFAAAKRFANPPSPLSGMHQTLEGEQVDGVRAPMERDAERTNNRQAPTSPPIDNMSNVGDVSGSSYNSNTDLRIGGEGEEEDDRSIDTEDSEERRLWQEFPEQTRRHPPGMIAFELQQRQLQEEREAARRNTSSKTPPYNSQEGGSSMIAEDTRTTSPNFAAASSSTTYSEGSARDSLNNSAGSLVPQASLSSIQDSVLLPIQEESISSNSTTDDELEWLNRRPY